MIDLHKTTRDWRSGQEAELEDPELTSFHEHTTITAMYLQSNCG